MYLCKGSLVVSSKTWLAQSSLSWRSRRPGLTINLQAELQADLRDMYSAGKPQLPSWKAYRNANFAVNSPLVVSELSQNGAASWSTRLSDHVVPHGSAGPQLGGAFGMGTGGGGHQRANGNGAFLANGAASLGGVKSGVREPVLPGGRANGDVAGFLRDEGADVGPGRSSWNEVPYLTAGRGEGEGEEEKVVLSPPERDSLRRRGSKVQRGGPLWIVSVVAAGVFVGVCYFAHWKYGYRDSEWNGPAPPPPVAATTGPEHILGHFKVDEAPLEDLIPVEADGRVQLRTAAALAFLKMQAAARAEGVSLLPLSGFRSKADQTEIFHGVKAQRRQTAAQRAAVSAPAGYSEHHTGYALDIGDGHAAHSHLEEEFETTVAYDWLCANAALYHFELSFPRGNKQGVMYEPWHWRFVGDDHSLKTFYAQRAQTYVLSN